MKPLSFSLCAVCVSIIAAATFKAPVYSVPRKGDKFRSRITDMSVEEPVKSQSHSRHIQQPLRPGTGRQAWRNSDDAQEVGEKATGVSSIWDVEDWVYITEITVGTPPQHFRVLLSISDSDILLPSDLCNYSCDDHTRYQSNLSSTYVPNGTVLVRNYIRFSANGVVSQDTFRIAGIEVKNVTFAQAKDMYRHGDGKGVGLGDDNWDGILGLAPYANNVPQSYFPADLDAPFLSMVSQGLLDKNVLGLKLSRGMDDPGEIMFGGINNTDDRRQIRGRWNVPAISMSLGPGSASLEGYAATLDSDDPFIRLPFDFVYLLYEYLGMEQKGDTMVPYPIPFSIDCAKRAELEDFTLTLGGHDFVITPYEYTIEMNVEEWGGHRCISAFLPLQDYGETYIVVGSAFLRAFYAVFDLDERTVSLGNLKRANDWKPEL